MTPAQRAAVVAEAMTWRKTPFHHNARLKGVGVDCANLLVAAYAGAGLLPSLELGEYARNWHMHQDEPRFLEEIKRHCDPLPAGEEPLPGDIVMFIYGLHASHGAIVTAWPQVIHAWAKVGKVVLSDVDSGPLAERLDSIWRLREVAR